MDFFGSQRRPARSVQRDFQFKRPEVPKRTPRVVDIPVHFVGLEANPSGSALKIQKAFRGFLVRKSVQKIRSIKRQVDSIEARISRSEVVDLIRNDAKERLRVNETLMALLFELDAVTVSGVDSGIRVFRRAVTKKAIALQERVDSIANTDPIQAQTLVLPLPGEDNDSAHTGTPSPVDQTQNQIQVQNFDFDDDVLEKGSDKSSAGDRNDEERKLQVSHDKPLSTESGQSKDLLNSDKSLSNTLDNMDDGGDSAEELECVEQQVENCDGQSEIEGGDYNCVEEEMIENAEVPGAELQVDSSLMDEVNEEDRCDKTSALSECVQESVDIGHNVENGVEVNGEEEVDASDVIIGYDKGVGNGDKKEKELLERMVEQNGKMMTMMNDLSERNVAQSRMLNTLTHRVEQLEKAFVCDKIRRMKKRHCR